MSIKIVRSRATTNGSGLEIGCFLRELYTIVSDGESPAGFALSLFVYAGLTRFTFR